MEVQRCERLVLSRFQKMKKRLSLMQIIAEE
jgi:hypothetical protein